MRTDPSPPPSRHQRGTTPSEMRLPGGFGPLVIALVVALALAVGFALMRGRLSTLAVGNNALEQVAKIEGAIAAADWEQAAAALRVARAEHPEDAAVMRVTTVFLDKTGAEPPLQLQLLASLRERGLGASADALLEGRAHLRNGNLTRAREVLASLSAAQQNSSDALALKAAILAQEGETAKAHATQEQAHARATDDPAAPVRRAVAAMSGPLVEARDTALADLWVLSAAKNIQGLEALRLLVDRRDLSVGQAETILRHFDNHPDHDLADHLSAVSALIRADPGRRGALLEHAAKPDSGRSLDDTLVLARWLAFEKEHDRLMKLAPEATLLGSKELFPIVLQSMAQAGRWTAMLALFKKHQSLPMPGEGILVWKALASSRMHDNLDEAAHLLKLAITQSQAVKNHSVLRAAAQAAQDLHLWDIAFSAYSTLAAVSPEHELEMLEKCWGIAVIQGDLGQQIDTARRQSALRPTSGHFARRLDYLRLLLGDEMESAVSEPVPSRPDPAGGEDTSAVGVLLEALKAYRLGNTPAMSRALLTIRSPGGLTPGQRAVYAGMLAAMGDTARAFQIAERIPPHGLAAEEKAFLRKAL